MLAAKAPPKKHNTRLSAASAAAYCPVAASLAKRPTLPVTCELKVPTSTKPLELTNPPTRAKYPASQRFWLSDRALPSRENNRISSRGHEEHFEVGHSAARVRNQAPCTMTQPGPVE